MAHIYPTKENLENMPLSERMVYEYLEKLPDTFYVFHSVQWLKRTNKWQSTWKENDFLIFNQKLGGLVLEVKGGDIKFYDGAFHQINSQTGEENILSEKKRNDPLTQAIDGAYRYRRLLDGIGCGLRDKFPIEVAVWFPMNSIEKKRNEFPLAYRDAGKAILGNEAFSKGNLAINEVFDSYSSREKVGDISDKEFQKILDSIAQDFHLTAVPSVYREEIDKTFIRLTNEQKGLLDYISEQRTATIQGVAGTGKTIIAQEAARRFADDGRKVLFLCFNKFLFSDLQRRYPYENVTYYNIHTFISKYSGCKDLSILEKRIDELWKINIDNLDFDDVVIDEAQDFENDEILYFKELMDDKEGHFLVFYDKNQLLTTAKVPEWITNSECRLVLTKNCRNTVEIAKTAYNVIDVEFNPKMSMVSGEPTSICFVKGNYVPVLARLISLLKDDSYGFENGDITILSMKPENASLMGDVDNISKTPVLHERSQSGIFYTTSKKFKGLESKVVIVVDVDDKCFIDEAQKRNFYVACSRATHKLVLFVDGDETILKKIADNIPTKGSVNGKIIMKTHSRVLELKNV